MTKRKRLSESLEDYLEVIFELERDKKVARAKDIAQKMGVQRGSVTHVLKTLEEKALINYEPYSFITLTQRGKNIAREISQRHNVLKKMLVNILNIDEEVAESTACRMEHAIDSNSLERLLAFFDFIYRCPRAGEDWIESFVAYCSSGKTEWHRCDQCIQGCLSDHQENRGRPQVTG